jgi:HEAT repeat protein
MEIRSVQDFASTALLSIGPKAIPSLRNALLTDPDNQVRIGAVLTIIDFIEGDINDKTILDTLIKLTQDSDPELRRHAVRGLGKMGPEAAGTLPRLTGMLKADPAERVRYNAIEALEGIDPEGKTVIPALIGALRDQDPDVRSIAARTLGHLGARSKSAVPALVAMLKDDGARCCMISAHAGMQVSVRWDAVEALGLIGPDASAAYPPLRVMFEKEPEAGTQVVVALALFRLNPLDFEAMAKIMKELAALESRVEDGPREDGGDEAISAITELGQKARAAVPMLLKLLKHKLWEIRMSAAQALGEVGDESVLPNLVDTQKDEDQFVREEADKAVKKIRGRKPK